MHRPALDPGQPLGSGIIAWDQKAQKAACNRLQAWGPNCTKGSESGPTGITGNRGLNVTAGKQKPQRGEAHATR